MHIVSQIKSRVSPDDYDLRTAEGRLAFDDCLRTELRKIDDDNLRVHAGELIKEWRRGLFGMPTDVVHHLSARLDAIEARLGIKTQTEINDLRSICSYGATGDECCGGYCDMNDDESNAKLAAKNEDAYCDKPPTEPINWDVYKG